MNVVGALRVKNESRWIRRCLDSIRQLCTAGIVVFDDHSTDSTAVLAAESGATVIHSPFEGLGESRDKNYLLDVVRPFADYVVMIDGDEVMADWCDDRLIANALESNRFDCLSLPILYLWDKEDQMRVDGVYGEFRRESIFRPGAHRFEENGGVGFHCGNVPPACRRRRGYVEVPLLHYGYLHREDRIRKLAWYREHDPNNDREDDYRHIAQGDVPEIPADAKLKHAGPLRLRSLEARIGEPTRPAGQHIET